ncbi:MAG: Lytic transglycosylase catalytic [Thermoleophilia bacterium]|nr:Lytic transglycosylase catalytic [Thermoleophilia bacterium]
MVLLCLALVAFVPLAAGAGSTIEFTPSAPTAPLEPSTDPFSPPTPPRGVSADKIEFSYTAADRKAQAAAAKAEDFLAKAGAATGKSAIATGRIEAIEDLLTAAQGNADRLKGEIEVRLVAQYKEGEAGDLRFLLDGKGLSGLVDRSRVLRDQNSRDANLAEDYANAVGKLETLKMLLMELRDIEGERAESYVERAERQQEHLVAARAAHMEAPDATAEDPKAGLDGTWYVMDGAFQAQLFLPTGASAYTGGTRTAARQATVVQIQRVLADPRIVLDASGYNDVATGQIDGRLLDALSAAANRFNVVKVTSLKSDHGVYTAGGNVSAHSYGCAADIGTIGKTYITPSSQVQGSEVHQAVLFFAALGSFQADLGPHQVISLFDLGGATLSMGDHGDHIHLGYAC